jgi:hypothetical protein
MLIIKISVIAFVFYILGEPGMIFGWYQRLISNLPEWLWKPLGGCLKCWSGQVAFWYYLVTNFKSYNLIDHLFFTSACILVATTLNYLYGITKT